MVMSEVYVGKLNRWNVESLERWNVGTFIRKDVRSKQGQDQRQLTAAATGCSARSQWQKTEADNSGRRQWQGQPSGADDRDGSLGQARHGHLRVVHG